MIAKEEGNGGRMLKGQQEGSSGDGMFCINVIPWLGSDTRILHDVAKILHDVGEAGELCVIS